MYLALFPLRDLLLLLQPHLRLVSALLLQEHLLLLSSRLWLLLLLLHLLLLHLLLLHLLLLALAHCQALPQPDRQPGQPHHHQSPGCAPCQASEAAQRTCSQQ